MSLDFDFSCNGGEVLPIGEKIKRIRIYKGIKLKDISSENLSISKISYIENGKIKPDKASLEILAKSLGTTYEYLSKDIPNQILDNINYLNSNFDFEKYKYNLEIAISNEFYEIVFYICNQIFKKVVFEKINLGDNEKIISIIPIYANALTKLGNYENNLIYNLDLACYLFTKGEYSMSAYRFNFLRKMSLQFNSFRKYEVLVFINELTCYVNLNNYDKIYGLMDDIESYMESCEDEDMYIELNYFKMVWIMKYDFKNFNVENVLSFLDSYSYDKKVKFIYKISRVLKILGYDDKCIYLCEKLVDIIKEENILDNNLSCEVLLYVCETFIEKNVMCKIDPIMEESLKLSSCINHPEYVFKAYFNKALLYYKKNDLKNLENLLNFVVCFLNRINDKEHRDKFLDIGFMFHKLGDIQSAINILNKL